MSLLAELQSPKINVFGRSNRLKAPRFSPGEGRTLAQWEADDEIARNYDGAVINISGVFSGRGGEVDRARGLNPEEIRDFSRNIKRINPNRIKAPTPLGEGPSPDTPGEYTGAPATILATGKTSPSGGNGTSGKPDGKGPSNTDYMDAALSGLRLFAETMNAESTYNAIKRSNDINIGIAYQNAQDSLSRGAQRGFAQESRGRVLGEASLIQQAAQGIDVRSSGAQRIKASQEAVGIQNALIEETNSVAEALGFEVKAEYLRGQTEAAKIQRNFNLIESSLNFALTAGSKAF